jgi:hypothetical protein
VKDAPVRTHPSQDDLRRFGSGQLSAEEAVPIEAHLPTCPNCCLTLKNSVEDSLIDLLRSAVAAAPVPEPPASGTAAFLPASALPTATLPPAAHATQGDVEFPPELRDHPRYRVLELLGKGGMGAVYKAEHRLMERTVALKIIGRDLTTRPEMVERFRREVKAAARLTHPNIVHAFDAEQAGDTHLLVMEFVPGTNLGGVVAERGPLPVLKACDYIRQAALGLQYAHEHGMVHRDIKPHNLMRTPNGQVKILDFGLARLVREQHPDLPNGSQRTEPNRSHLTEEGVFMGSADYVAPEQASDPRKADIRADIYSLGCTLYHLLTGRVPFPAATVVDKLIKHAVEEPVSPSELRSDLPAGLEAVLAKMMAKRPEQRYQSPGEVADALTPFTVFLPAPAAVAVAPSQTAVLGDSAFEVPEPAGSGRKRLLRRPIGVAAAMLFVVLAVAGVAVYRIQTDKGELVITSESDDVKVVIKQGGKQVDVIDTKTDKQITLALRSGVYELELKGAPEGLKLNIDKATLTRGETVLARIERVPKPGLEAREPAKTAKIQLVRRFSVPAVANLHYDVGVSKDGKFAFVTRDIAPGCELTMFNVLTGEKLFSCPGYMAAFLDSEHLVVDGDNKFRVYEAKSGALLREGAHKEFYALRVAPGGKHLFYTNSKGLVLFDLTRMKDQHTFEGKQGYGEFSADGKHLFVYVGETLVRPTHVWDVENDRATEDIGWLKKEPWGFQFLPDGKRVLAIRDGKYAYVDASTGKLLATLASTKLPAGSMYNIVVKGHFLLAGFEDGTVRLLSLATGQEIARFQLPPEDPVVRVGWHTRIAVSSDNRYASVVTRSSLWVLRLPPVPEANVKP